MAQQTEIKTFTGGWDSDTAPYLQKPEVYRMMVNLHILTSDEGNGYATPYKGNSEVAPVSALLAAPMVP